MELSITGPGNASTGTVQVSDVTFAREFNEDLVHQAVVAYMAGGRQGTRVVAVASLSNRRVRVAHGQAASAVRCGAPVA